MAASLTVHRDDTRRSSVRRIRVASRDDPRIDPFVDREDPLT
jgi:hypothetical protein